MANSLPVCSWSLVQGSCPAWTVLTAQPGRAGHVIIWDCWWFDWLQGFVRSISSGQRKKDLKTER